MTNISSVSIRYCINRIRLEFKAKNAAESVINDAKVLIESDWNLKHDESLPHARTGSSINRIRLEFKASLAVLLSLAV